MIKVATIRKEHTEQISCENCKYSFYNVADKIMLCKILRLYGTLGNCPNNDYSSWEYRYEGDVVSIEYISEEASE